jgi:uncharacterized delta-60 repeat protein
MKTISQKFAGNFLSTRLSQLVVYASLEWASTLTLAQARHLDTTFATRGIFSFQLTTNDGSNCVADAVALQSDGKIVAAGQLGNQSGLIRLNPNGSLDSSFGNGGVVVTKIGSDIDQVFGGVAIQSDGKIVAVGTGIPGGSGWHASIRTAVLTPHSALRASLTCHSTARCWPYNLMARLSWPGKDWETRQVSWHVSTARANWIPHSVPVD